MSKKCVTCGTEFENKRSDAKYCSDNCRYKNFYKNSNEKFKAIQNRYKNKKKQASRDNVTISQTTPNQTTP